MENNLVVKANSIIEAQYRLDLMEQKIILYAISKLNQDQDKFNLMKLETGEFMGLLGTTTFRYTEVRQIIMKLMSKQVRIETDDGELIVNWVSSLDYKKNDGIIELEFSDKLIPYLLQLKKRFTRYKLKNILNLKNKYSIRIYELLKQREDLRQREFDLEELKQILGCEDKYKDFRNLNKYVLKPTVEEINQHTDIKVELEKITKGRKVIGIKYKIERQLSDMEKLTTLYDMADIRSKCGLDSESWSDSQILELYSIACEKAEDIDVYSYVKINYLEMIRGGKARNKFAYLKKSLEEDYAKAYNQIKFQMVVS